jgi:seryl-tRNA synthetase
MTTDKELTSDQEQMWQKLENPYEYVVCISCVVVDQLS